MAKVAIQGGVDNYLGKQPQVVAPRKWKSSPDKPETELAYITKAEKDLIIKENIHGGLEGGPNMGPSGIMSLDSFGDAGGGGAAGGDTDAGGGYDGDKFGGSSQYDYSTNVSTAQLPPGVTSGSSSVNTKKDEQKAKKEARDFRQNKYLQGYRPVTIGDKRNAYNINYRQKQLARYQKAKIDELNAKLKGLKNFDGYYGDTEETYGDFIKGYAPSITEFGPDGTGKYSQQFINDVLSGKRQPPESFMEIDVASVPGIVPKGLAMGANFIGKKMAGPTTYEELMDIYSDNKTGNSYIGARDFDITKSNAKDMMEIFEPNRFQMLYGNDGGSGEGQNQQQYIPYLSDTGTTEDDDKEFPYRLGYGQKVGRDVRLGYAANGGRIGKAFGGIMDTATGRKRYFLGSVGDAIGDVVGGVAKAAKKVLSSDVGKMAMLGGGAYLAGGYLPGGKGIMGGFSNFSNLAKNALLKDRALGFTKDNLSLGKILGLSAALPFIPGINDVKQDTMPDGYGGGKMIDPLTGEEGTPASMRANIEKAKEAADGDPDKLAALNQKYNNMLFTNLPYPQYGLYSIGGRVAAQEGGLMDLGGMEKDYRAEGGFVPIGREEKADDVPARLSVNEFVFTADAVRNAGGGDIDKGAEVMENMMKNLENGGRVSEESQGNTGAQEMFSVSERIGEVI